MPRVAIIKSPDDMRRIEEDRRNRAKRQMNMHAYYYIKECESKDIVDLIHDEEFHTNCYWGRPAGTPLIVARKHAIIATIAKMLINVRTGNIPMKSFIDSPECSGAVKWARQNDPDFFQRYRGCD